MGVFLKLPTIIYDCDDSDYGDDVVIFTLQSLHMAFQLSAFSLIFVRGSYKYCCRRPRCLLHSACPSGSLASPHSRHPQSPADLTWRTHARCWGSPRCSLPAQPLHRTPCHQPFSPSSTFCFSSSYFYSTVLAIFVLLLFHQK